MRNFRLLCVLLVGISASEAGVIIPRDISSKDPSLDGSGAEEAPNPDFFGRDNNDGSVSTSDDFDDIGVNNPRGPSSDDEGLNPADKDYVNELDFSRPGNGPQGPAIDEDEENGEDEDQAIGNKDEEGSDINRPVDEDFYKPFNSDVDEADSEEDFKIPFDEWPMDDYEDPKETGFFHRGSFFDSPFFNVRQVSNYFHQLEKALQHVFRQAMEESTLLNGTYANTTEEEIEINGKKFIVRKSIIKGKDNNSSIYIEALSAVPKENGTKVVEYSG